MSRREPFGQVAVKLGCVSEDQLKEALRIQESLHQHDKEHKLLGMIMLEQGFLSTTGLIEILKYYDLNKAPDAGNNQKRSSAQS